MSKERILLISVFSSQPETTDFLLALSVLCREFRLVAGSPFREDINVAFIKDFA
jgi:hypothetical protein